MIIGVAVYDYKPPESTSLDTKMALRKGDQLQILKQDKSGWWHGVKINDPLQHGWFPASYVKISSNSTNSGANGVAGTSVDSPVSSGLSGISGKGAGVDDMREPQFNNDVDRQNQRASMVDGNGNKDDDDDYGDMSAIESQIQETNKKLSNRVSGQLRGNQSIDGDSKNVPDNWNYAKTVDGRKYLYNHVTNRTVWKIEDIGKNMMADKEDTVRIPEMEDLSVPVEGYEEYILDVVNSIASLNDCLKQDQKTKYFRKSRKIIASIQNLLLYTNNTAYDILPTETHNLMKAMSVFVLAIKTARNIWPPPDSKLRVRSAAGKILAAVKAYVSAAKTSGTELNKVSVSANQMRDRRDSSTDDEEQDEVVKIDEYAAKIKFTVDSLLDYIQKSSSVSGGNEEKNKAQIMAQKKVIESTSDITKHIGEILVYLDEMQVQSQFQSLKASAQGLKSSESNGDDMNTELSPYLIDSQFGEYNDCHENVSECLALLTAAASVAGQPFAPPNATREVLMKMSALLKSVKELIVIFKKMLACRNILEEKQLFQKIQEIEANDEKIYNRKLSSNDLISLNGKVGGGPPSASVIRKPSAAPLSESGLNKLHGEQSLTVPRTPRHNAAAVEQINNRFSAFSASTSSRATSIIRQMKSSFTQADLSSLHDRTGQKDKSRKGSEERSVTENRRNSQVFGPSSAARSPSASSGADSPNKSTKIKKFFGEETTDEEAKKLSIISSASLAAAPWYLEADFGKDEIIMTMDSNAKVKYGTLHALIARMTSHNLYDADFTSIFLFTFRSYINPETFCDYMIERFNIFPPENISAEELTDWNERKRMPIRLRVLKSIKKWIEEIWYHETDRVAIPTIRRITKELIAPIYPREGEKLLDLCTKREKSDISIASKLSLISSIAVISNDPESKPLPVIPKIRLTSGSKAVLDIDPSELARQLTIIESRIFLKINPIEVLYYKPDDKSQDLCVRHMITGSNQITGWIAETILLEKDVKKRANLIRHFIKVAERCHHVKNFASRQSILAALNSTPIFRLKKTWEMVPAKAKTAFETLSKLMDRENNFMTYRHTLKSTIAPCVPFLGLYLTDVIFIKQGNPDKVSDGRLLNFDKCSKLAAILDEINRFQSASYQFVEIEEMIEDLGNLLKNSRDIQELHELSLMIEPREKAMVRSSSVVETAVEDQVLQNLLDQGFI